MDLRAYGDKVIVRPSPAKEKTDGGLHIPETMQRRPFEGTIIAIGPRAAEQLDHDGVHKGDRVVLSAAAVDIRRQEVGGEEYIACHYDNVLAKVEGECGVIEGRSLGHNRGRK